MFLRCLKQVIRTFTISGKHPQNNRHPSDSSEKCVTTISCLFYQGIVFWRKPDFGRMFQLISRSSFTIRGSENVSKKGLQKRETEREWFLLSYSSEAWNRILVSRRLHSYDSHSHCLLHDVWSLSWSSCNAVQNVQQRTQSTDVTWQSFRNHNEYLYCRFLKKEMWITVCLLSS